MKQRDSSDVKGTVERTTLTPLMSPFMEAMNQQMEAEGQVHPPRPFAVSQEKWFIWKCVVKVKYCSNFDYITPTVVK